MARKEMHFFGKDLHFEPHFYLRNEAEYLAEFEAGAGKRQSGEASVWYLFSKTAAAEIKAFNPEARIIVMLREPVEMLHSLFYQFRFDGNENLRTFEEALAAESDRQIGRRLCRETYLAQGLVYRETARYTKQLERYFSVFGRDRVHVILYEEFAANPAAAYRETLKFLGVDSQVELPEFHRVNAAKSVRFTPLRALLNDSALRSAILRVRPLLPRPAFVALHKIEAAVRRLNSRPDKRPPMDGGLRARLQQEFKPEIARLGSLLGRDLSNWGRGRSGDSEDTAASDRAPIAEGQLSFQASPNS